MPGQVLAQFIYIHPGREAAVGGVILRQGTQFPDFLEQCGNRLGRLSNVMVFSVLSIAYKD